MTEKIAQFLKKRFGFKALLKPLRGYEDINYLVELDGKPRYVVKISKNGERLNQIKAQEELFIWLSSTTEYAFPSILKDKDGCTIFDFDNDHSLRLLTYLEGNFLAEADITGNLLSRCGQFLGYLDNYLASFRNATIESRHHEWDLQYFDEYSRHLESITSPERRKIVSYFLVQFNNHVRPQLPDLRKSIIHNDANDWNVLISGKSIRGIIDFGDIVFSQTVNELAVASAYMAMGSADPLARLFPLVRGYHQKMPLNEGEISVLYYLIASRLCISVCQSAMNRQKDPGNEYISIHEDRAWQLLDQWIAIAPEKAGNTFREACGIPLEKPVPADWYQKKRRRFFSNALSLSYNRPVVMDSAAFQYMYGDRGATYLDCVNNIMHVGHCHPDVVRAAQKQMATLNTNTRYYYKALIRYAEALLRYFPDRLNKVFFVNSGSAATDLALRLARNHTSREGMIVLEHGYHGNTAAAIAVSHYKFAGRGGKGPEPHIRVASLPDTYRGKYKAAAGKTGEKYAGTLYPLLDESIAGFICEPIVGCGGQVMLPDNYLPLVYEKVRESGGVCIADEVQTGMGRTGSHFWAYERYEVIPDIVILGKPAGNGHPIGAVVCSAEIASSFDNGMEFFSSFGGNPVSCETGLAVLEVIRNEELQTHALSVGNFLLDSFRQLSRHYPLIGNVRGSGLFLGVELVKDPLSLVPATGEAKKIVDLMREKGVLLSTDGPFNNVIKIKPPMCISLENGHTLIELFEDTLNLTYS